MPQTRKYSQFPFGGDLVTGDIVVGLRGGLNTSFNANTGAGGGGSTLTVTQVAHGFDTWESVYLNSAVYTSADASNDTTGEMIGLVVEVLDADRFVVQQTGHASSSVQAIWGPFVAGTVYFLSELTAGECTPTAPSTDGEVVKPCFIATDVNSGWIFPYRGEILGPTFGSGGGGSDAPSNASYVTNVPESGLSNEQALSLLGSGIMYNTTATGVVSIAVNGTDYYGPGMSADVPVIEGGTGVGSFTAYGVITGGTTATGALQSVASTGVLGQVLTSNGAAALPTFKAASSSSSWSLVSTVTISTDVYVNFESLSGIYMFQYDSVRPAQNNVYLRAQVGTGGTPTYSSSGYQTSSLASKANVSVVGSLQGAQGPITTGIVLTSTFQTMLATTTGTDCGGTLYARGMLGGPGYSRFECRSVWGTNTGSSFGFGGGQWGFTTAVTAIRFSMNTGTMLSGTISCYKLTA